MLRTLNGRRLGIVCYLSKIQYDSQYIQFLDHIFYTQVYSLLNNQYQYSHMQHIMCYHIMGRIMSLSNNHHYSLYIIQMYHIAYNHYCKVIHNYLKKYYKLHIQYCHSLNKHYLNPNIPLNYKHYIIHQLYKTHNHYYRVQYNQYCYFSKFHIQYYHRIGIFHQINIIHHYIKYILQ